MSTYLASYATGAGQVADVAMLLVGGFYLGKQAFDVFKDLIGFAGAVNATAYVYNTESYDETVLTLIHEGLHAMGIRDSRRAEALVRLAEKEHQGISITRKVIRQVLQDMKDAKVYDDMPWQIGGESPHFPGVKF